MYICTLKTTQFDRDAIKGFKVHRGIGCALRFFSAAGAEVGDDARAAFGIARAAELAAEMHPLVVDEQPIALRVDLQQFRFHFRRRVVVACGKAQAMSLGTSPPNSERMA